MSMLLYATESGEIIQRLHGVIGGLLPEEKVEFYQAIDLLTRRLRQPRGDMGIAVLLAANREDLLEILSIRELLDDMRTILILPDRGEDTIARGHNLRPRYITYVDSDFSDVASVLSKMLGEGYPTT